MSFKVFLTDDAARDLEDLYTYVESHDLPDKADHLLDRIEKSFATLSENPNRGSYPRELSAIGLKEFREVYFKPYRVIYRVIGKKVYVLVIADGRRDMQSLLQRRLLHG